MTLSRNIYVVDDDESVCESLTTFLSSAGFHAVSFSSGFKLVEAAAELEPGCVLLDMRMPQIDGLSVMNLLGDVRDRLAVIIMTGHGDITSAVAAMRAGAVDFIEKPFEEALILRVIDQARETLASKIKALERRTAATERLATLTPRETDVLRGLIDGRPNKLLAFDLGISVRTVEMHRAHLMDRLGVTSAAQVIRLAYDAGLIDRRASRTPGPAIALVA